MKKLGILAAITIMTAALAGCGASGETTGNADGGTNVNTEGSTSAEIDEDWPDGTVYVYVGSKAGGGSDTVMRIYAQFFEKYTGEKFSVVNDTTGNGAVVYENVIGADKNGMDLLFGSTASYVSYFNGQVSAPLNDREAFTLLGVMSCPVEESNSILIVRKDAPYSTLEEYVEYAKAHPGEIRFGLQNGGGSQYLAVLMDSKLGIEEKYVESGSVADKLVSLVGGNIDACVVYPKQAAQYLETGDVKAIAVLGDERSSITPDVPSFTEKGYEPVEMEQYQGLFGPAGMNPATVNAINQMIQAANADPEVIEQIETQGMAIHPISQEEGYEIYDREFALYEEVSKMTGSGN